MDTMKYQEQQQIYTWSTNKIRNTESKCCQSADDAVTNHFNFISFLFISSIFSWFFFISQKVQKCIIHLSIGQNHCRIHDAHFHWYEKCDYRRRHHYHHRHRRHIFSSVKIAGDRTTIQINSIETTPIMQ